MLLADTYIHVKYSRREAPTALARQLEPRVINIAREIFVSDAKLEYLLEDGTLIQRARLFKAILAIIGAIAGYHELRESAINMYDDANRFSHWVIEEFHKITDTSPSSVIYKRTLPTDVRRLYRIIQETDRLNSETLTHRQQYDLQQEIVSDIADLHYSNPNDNGVEVILNNLPRKKMPELPKTVEAIVAVDQRRRKLEAKEVAKGIEGPPREVRRRRRYFHITTI